ncbi:MAG: DUF5602 domain-containing protein [Armatimonadota bacterium]
MGRPIGLAMLLAGLLLGSLTPLSAAGVERHEGAKVKVGTGSAYTWLLADGLGSPLAIGISITDAALASLPAEDVAYTLPLPRQARETPFTHVVVNWNVHGHIPPGIYDVPHFDYHFYIITPEQRAQITATGEDLARVTRMPAPAAIPQGYIGPEGTFEPEMGWHWIDPASPEFHGQPFTETFIYGFYNGQMAFLEPMVTSAFLAGRPFVSRALALPAVYPAPGYYPTGYAISYDARRKETSLSLWGLTKR